MSQAIEYYLKGTFNSWEAQNAYKFVNNTNEMGYEEGKIREYKLENIALDKAAKLKLWANNDVWFKDGANNCTYEHHWSNSIEYADGDDHNYIVPMTSNTYSFYLKFYSNGSSKLYITANKDVLFFIPSSDWKQAGANFAIGLFTENNNDKESPDQQVAPTSENPSGTFRYDIGTTYQRYNYLRKNDSNTGIWNKSNIQTVGNTDTNNCFSLYDSYWNDWNPDGSHGTWSAK